MIRSTLSLIAVGCMLALAACSQSTPAAPVVSAPPAATATTTASKVTTAVQKGAALAQTVCADAKTGELFVQIFDPSLITSNKDTVTLATAACNAVGAVAATLPPSTTAPPTPSP